MPTSISTFFPYTTLFRSEVDAPAEGEVPVVGAGEVQAVGFGEVRGVAVGGAQDRRHQRTLGDQLAPRSEEHTSELQSRVDLVCRLLLEKKNGSIGTQVPR